MEPCHLQKQGLLSYLGLSCALGEAALPIFETAPPGLLQGGLKGGDCPAIHLEEAVPWEPVSSMEAGATSDLFFAVALMPPVEGLHLWNEPVNAIVMPLFFKCLQQRDAGPYVISSLNGPPQHPIFSVSCWHLFAVLLVYPVMPAMCWALRGM